MSRFQSSLPAKSKPFKIPVPVMTNTFLPSVTGDGDDMFCLRILTLPAPNSRFQTTSPLLRLRHHKERLSPSATLRKIRSFQMMGVDPLQLGSVSFQATFSSAVQREGRSFSVLNPLRL